MQLILSTSDITKTAKKKEKTKSFAYVLLKEFYESLKLDILNGYTNNKPLDREKYKQDLQSILKIIYNKVFLNYDFLLNNYTVKQDKKANPSVDGIDKIKEQITDKKNSLFEEFIVIRASLIFDNLENTINDIFNNAGSEYQEIINSIQSKIQTVSQKLQRLLLLNKSPQIQKQIQKLNREQTQLQSEIQRRVASKDQIVKNTFIQKYSENIAKNRAFLQADNEVDFISNKLKKTEYNAIKDNYLTLRVDNQIPQKIQRYKRWNATLDKRTRITHAFLQGAVVKEDESFAVYNPITRVPEYAKEPKDENLSPENAINCRCEVEYFVIIDY